MSISRTANNHEAAHSTTDQRRAVLLALDGSPASAMAAPAARLIAALLNATLRILYVARDYEPHAVVRQRLQLERYGLDDCDLHVQHGEPAAGILQTMHDPSIRMIVLTTHGRIIEPGRQLGRVAEAVVAGTTRPILLIRPEAAAEAAEAVALRRLLLPLDGTPTTMRALGSVAQLACELDATFDLLFVTPAEAPIPVSQASEPGTIGVPRYVDQPQYEWPAWGSEVVERLDASCERHPLGLPTRVFVARGAIEDEIVRFAAEHREDVVVLVRRSGLEPGRARALRAVLAHTPCPVLLTGVLRSASAVQREARSWHERSSAGDAREAAHAVSAVPSRIRDGE